MTQWFACYPAGIPWSLVSYYCVGDGNKENDAFSFSNVASHGKVEKICEYIASAAPKDLKNTNEVPLCLFHYLTCEVPVTFTVTFVMRPEAALLRDYMSVKAMTTLDAEPFPAECCLNLPQVIHIYITHVKIGRDPMSS